MAYTVAVIGTGTEFPEPGESFGMGAMAATGRLDLTPTDPE
ncbi:hypothetical protein [Haloarcula montana]|nr:hypothetical protein [Haloarcula sp. GH36]